MLRLKLKAEQTLGLDLKRFSVGARIAPAHFLQQTKSIAICLLPYAKKPSQVIARVFRDPDWIAFGDPGMRLSPKPWHRLMISPKLQRRRTALPGIFIFPLWQASLPATK